MSGDAELWDGLTEHIHSTMGQVGIPKMLGASSEGEARRRWLSHVAPFLSDLRAVVGVEAAGPPTDAEAGGLGEDLGYPVIAALFRERVVRGEVKP